MEATPPPQPGGQYGAPPPSYPPATGGARLDTARTFDRIFELYRAQFLVLMGAALAVFVPIALIDGAVLKSGSAGLVAVASLIGAIGQAFYTGAVVEAVQDMRDGRRDFGIGQLFSRAVPFIVPLAIAGFVFYLGLLIGLVLIIVPGLIWLTWFCLFAPSIVVERQGIFGSLGRSRDLVRGNAMRVFGVLLVTVVVVLVISSLVQRIIVHGNSSYAVALVAGLVGNLITAPVFGLTVSALYYELRDAQQGTSGMASPAPPPRV